MSFRPVHPTVEWCNRDWLLRTVRKLRTSNKYLVAKFHKLFFLDWFNLCAASKYNLRAKNKAANYQKQNFNLSLGQMHARLLKIIKK